MNQRTGRQVGASSKADAARSIPVGSGMIGIIRGVESESELGLSDRGDTPVDVRSPLPRVAALGTDAARRKVRAALREKAIRAAVARGEEGPAALMDLRYALPMNGDESGHGQGQGNGKGTSTGTSQGKVRVRDVPAGHPENKEAEVEGGSRSHEGPLDLSVQR